MVAEGKVRIGVVHGSVTYVWLVVIIVSIIQIRAKIDLLFNFLQRVFEKHCCLFIIHFFLKSRNHLLARLRSTDIEKPGLRASPTLIVVLLLFAPIKAHPCAIVHVAIVAFVWNERSRHAYTQLSHQLIVVQFKTIV